jgi:hypothetical protein
MKGSLMSHLSQLVSESLAQARITQDFVKSEPSADRTKLTFDGKTYYIVCLSEEEMMHLKDGLEVAYGDDEAPGWNVDQLIERFAV